jgi:uncharacterized protein (TIGR02099 family)
MIRRLWRISAGVFAVVVVLLAIVIGLVRIALVQVPEYREQIESWAGEALGWPVEIGAMDARLGWRGPELRFADARILARDHEQTLVVASTGSMQFDSWSLLRGELRPGAVSLAGVSLRIERNANGRWRLLGEDGPAFGEGAGDAPRLEELPVGNLRLEDVTVEFEDLRQELGPWLFQVDTLEVQAGAGQLAVAVAGRLPGDLGEDLALSFVLTAQDARGHPRDWTAGMTFTALDIGAVGAAIGLPARLHAQGVVDGSLSVAMDGNGMARLVGEVLALGVLPPVPPQAEPGAGEAVPYDSIGGGFEWTRTASGWNVAGTKVEIARAGRQWTSPTASLVFEEDTAGRRIEAGATRLQIEDLLPIIGWLPPRERGTLEEISPTGALRDLVLHVDVPSGESQPPEAHINARFEDVSFAGTGRLPGVRNLSGTVSGDLHRGTARIDSRDGAVELPWMFRESLAFSTLGASLDWTRDEQEIRLQVAELEIENADASISSHGLLQIDTAGGSPRLEIEGVARDIRLEAVPRYLPVSVMPKKAVKWLDEAALAGRVDEAQFRLQGATRDFPFRNGGGEFKVEFEVAEGALTFLPDWPRVTGLQAGVRFENEGLWAQVRSGRLLRVDGGPAQVSIPDFAQSVLLIQARAEGGLAAFREFALASELLKRILLPGLAPANVQGGQVAADIDLVLPLRALRDYRAGIELQIRNGVVAYGFLGEPLRDVNARIRIDNSRVTAKGVTATLAGSPLSVDVATGADGAIRIEGGGRIDGRGLASVLRLPLDAWITGTTDWTGYFQFPVPGGDGPFDAGISSQLEGFASVLPAPFGKPSNEARDLELRLEFRGLDVMDVSLQWEEALRIAARLNGTGAGPVFGVVPEGLPGGLPGLVFSGAVAKLDLGAWLQFDGFRRMGTGGVPGAIAGGSLLIGQLSAPAVQLGDALIDLSRGNDQWQVEFTADRAAGRLEIPFRLYGPEPVNVRLERLWLGVGGRAETVVAEHAAPAGPAARVHPATVPGLDLEVQDLRYDAVRFGRVTARVLHETDGFELIGLEGTGDGFMFLAEGRSRLSDSVDESRLGVRILSDDVGAALEHAGFRRSMEAKQGGFEAEVKWQGGLRSDWLEAIEGNASISIQEGRLVGVEPGAGRVFGLISIEALPRRLALDFKDVFGEGTAFDRIAGDFRFANGSAYTDNLVMQGPAANMAVVGRTGLVARDYDQTAVIAADLGRTLPVAGAVVAGPAVGAALFLLSEVLRKPFQTQITYRLTGPWDNPVIDKLGAGGVPPPPPGDGAG